MESPNPQFRSLGQQAKVEYLEEKKRLESIPITAYIVLLIKSCEVTAGLWEALISGDNPDSGAIAQTEQDKDTSIRSYHVELSNNDRIKYDRIISHLDCSTDSSSIETS